jgi:hypothetical protein
MTTAVKHIEPKQYKGGKTLIISSTSSRLIGVKECKQMLGIDSRYTMNQYLKTLGLFGNHFLTWEQFKELLQLKTFLSLKPGYNSKTMYLLLRKQGSLQSIFTKYDIDIEAKLRKLQNDHNQRQA